ncbi:MAG: hypothetical protein KAW14_10070 [Candidatus Aegiribacteria sp.]|nr:hypothetical protein [Candidatus Aegiribacteria sp.]
MKIIPGLSLILILVFVIGCTGGDSNPESVSSVENTLRTILVPVDSIGIEMGDSNYVFGVIRAADFTTAGNVVIGDIASMKMSMFSSGGEYICSGGRQGEGPGEYAAPSGITPSPGGGIMVTDMMGGKFIFYDSLLVFSHELSGFIPNPPNSPVILDDGHIVGIRFIFNNEEGNLSNSLHRWEPGETEPKLTYFSRRGEFNRQNPQEVFHSTAINFCALPDGRVISSPMSTEEYIITCYTTEGEIDWEIQRSFERTRRSDEEIEIEREMMRAAMRRNGRDPAYVDQMDFQTWSDAVVDLETDGERIWARRGGVLVPLFDIYSTEGEYLYSCNVPDLPYGNSIAFRISPQGILAYLANPENYSKIYILKETDIETEESY